MPTDDSLADCGFATRALHAGWSGEDTQNSSSPPIYATASYTFDSSQHAADLFNLKEAGNIYSRIMNPTVDVFEKRVASLEGGAAAVAFASGLAAIQAAVCTLVGAGQNFVAGTSLYGGTWSLFNQTFKRFGIEVRHFNPEHPEEIDALVDDNTRMVYVETIGNPKWDVPDLANIAEKAHTAKLPFFVDNTSASPALCRPIEHGADVVIHSATKYLNGHGTHMGGVVVDSANFEWAQNPEKWPEFCAPNESYHGLVFEEAMRPMGNVAYAVHLRTNWLRDTGACLSPFAAFLFLQGIETLPLRMQKHSENALRVAEWLEAHDAVEFVIYPGLESHKDSAHIPRYLPNGQGGLMAFGIKGGKAAGEKLVDSVQRIIHVANIGDAKSLIIHPASTTHNQLSEHAQLDAGAAPGTLRLSVGIEDVEDILADLDQAIAASQKV